MDHARESRHPEDDRVSDVITSSDLNPPISTVVVDSQNSHRPAVSRLPVQGRKQPIERILSFSGHICTLLFTVPPLRFHKTCQACGSVQPNLQVSYLQYVKGKATIEADKIFFSTGENSAQNCDFLTDFTRLYR